MASTCFVVTIRATSVTVSNGEEAMYMLATLVDMLTYEDEFAEDTKTLGFLYDKETDTLFLHKGVDIDYLRRCLGNIRVEYDLYHPYKPMKFEYEEIIAPRDTEQEDVIDFITGQRYHAGNIEDSQVFLILGTGKGKTFCSGVGLCKLKMKTLIIMHRDALRYQWMKSLYTMNGLSSNEVHEITSTEELEAIAKGNLKLDYDVYLLTHATFRAGLNRIQKMKDVMNITKNLGIGLKIIDEAHLEFRDTLIMDFCFNVKRNLYLTATAGRSGKDENSIFRHVFSNATFYKPSMLLTSNAPKKWVNYTTVEVNTHCKPNIYKFRVAGGKGMNPASYGKWVIQYDKKHIHFKCIKDLVKLAYEKDQYAKIIVFLPLIDLCEDCVYFLKTQLDRDKDFEYDLDIRTICSKNSKKDNEYAQRSDIIVTTIQSCGTGTDIKGITTIISCSPYVSKITCSQVFGRIRYNGKIGDYYDIYDASVPMDRFWLKSRYKTFKHLALNVRNITWSDDEESNDAP